MSSMNWVSSALDPCVLIRSLAHALIHSVVTVWALCAGWCGALRSPVGYCTIGQILQGSSWALLHQGRPC